MAPSTGPFPTHSINEVASLQAQVVGRELVDPKRHVLIDVGREYNIALWVNDHID